MAGQQLRPKRPLLKEAPSRHSAKEASLKGSLLKEPPVKEAPAKVAQPKVAPAKVALAKEALTAGDPSKQTLKSPIHNLVASKDAANESAGLPIKLWFRGNGGAHLKLTSFYDTRDIAPSAVATAPRRKSIFDFLPSLEAVSEAAAAPIPAIEKIVLAKPPDTIIASVKPIPSAQLSIGKQVVALANTCDTTILYGFYQDNLDRLLRKPSSSLKGTMFVSPQRYVFE